MDTETFTSPLSFYTVETDYGNEALSLQPEERSTYLASHADEASPFPYFDVVSAGTAAPQVHAYDMSFMI